MWILNVVLHAGSRCRAAKSQRTAASAIGAESRPSWPCGTAATIDLFQPTFCKVDWRLFDPTTLTWEFEGERYLEVLKATPPVPT